MYLCTGCGRALVYASHGMDNRNSYDELRIEPPSLSDLGWLAVSGVDDYASRCCSLISCGNDSLVLAPARVCNRSSFLIFLFHYCCDKYTSYTECWCQKFFDNSTAFYCFAELFLRQLWMRRHNLMIVWNRSTNKSIHRSLRFDGFFCRTLYHFTASLLQLLEIFV